MSYMQPKVCECGKKYLGGGKSKRCPTCYDIKRTQENDKRAKVRRALKKVQSLMGDMPSDFTDLEAHSL